MKRLKFLLFFLFVLAVWASAASAQTKQKHSQQKSKTSKTKSVKAVEAPPKQLAYYPDFYTFYDPARGGYVYWKDSSWHVSQQRPAFMKEAQKGRVRVELLHDRTIGTYPEDNAERYMKLYPAQNVSPTTPVPILTITREHK